MTDVVSTIWNESHVNHAQNSFRVSLSKLPNGEFVVEFSALASRLDIGVEFHQCAHQIALCQLMVHYLQSNRVNIY